MNHSDELWKAAISNETEKVTDLLQNYVKTDEDVTSLARSYEAMTIKNISINEEMEYLIIAKLIENRFFMLKDKRSNQEIKLTEENVVTRVHIIKQHSEYLVNNYYQKNLDGMFSLRVQIIVQHLVILKKFLKTTYNILPWEEMEFCLLILLISISNHKEENYFYKLVLDKRRVLYYLKTFTDTLWTVSTKLGKTDINPKLRLPSRDTSVISVINSNSNFKDLYADYELVRDIYSLTKINYYLDEALKPNQSRGEKLQKLMIQRTLQVIGENLKNSTESPNVSAHVHDTLLKSAPSGLKEIITSLRDTLSHAHSLIKRLHIEGNQNELFIKIQNDLKLIQSEIYIVLNERKIKAVLAFSNKVQQCSNVDSVKYLLSLVTLGIDFFHEPLQNDFMIQEVEKIENWISKIQEGIHDKTNYEVKLFEKIERLLHLQKEKTKASKTTLVFLLSQFRRTVYNMKNLNDLRRITKMFSILNQRASMHRGNNANYFQNIILFLNDIYMSLRSRKMTNEFKVVDGYINHLMTILHIESDSVKKIGNFKLDLDKDDDTLEACNERETDSVIENILSSPISEGLKNKIKYGYENKKLIPEIKTQFTMILNEMKQDESYLIDEERLTEWENLVRKLDTKKQTEESLISYYKDKNISGLESLVNLINDTYTTLCRSFRDHNITINDKQQNAIKNFLTSLKLRKNEIDDIIKKFISNVEGKIKIHYADRLMILRDLLSTNGIFRSITKDRTLKITLEALLLDLLEILEDMSFFTDNRLFVDDFAPLLVGKALRNYLAHGSLFLDALPFKTTSSLLFNAFKLLECGEDLLDKKQMIGKIGVFSEEFIKERYTEALNNMKIQSEMFFHAEQNDIDNMKHCLEKGANIFEKSINGHSILSYAAKEDALECFEFVLNKMLGTECPGNDLDEQLCVSLNLAAVNGSKRIISFYIEHDLNLTCSADGTTIVHLIAKHGHADLMEKIIFSYLIDVNVHNKHKLSPLHLAAEYNHSSVVRVLLSSGCNTREKSLCLSTALHYASRNGHKETVELLLNHETASKDCVNELSSTRNTPLHLSAENGHKEIILLLLKHGADPFLRNSEDLTPLELSVRNGHLSVVEILYNFMFANTRSLKCINSEVVCANIKAIKDEILRLACSFGHVSILEFLINKHLNVNEVFTNGSTLLHIAVQEGWKDIVEILNAAGADVNTTNVQGYTPLHFACWEGHTDIVVDLLAVGAQVNILNNAGISPLSTACLFDYTEIIETLLSKGGDVNLRALKNITPLHAAVFSGNPKSLESLLKKGAKVNSRTSKGITPLHIAAKIGSDYMVNMLLKSGAIVNVKDENEYTPLHIACRDGKTAVARTLLDNGADINAVTAKRTKLVGEAEQVEENVMLSHMWSSAGAELNVNGLTPLHLAAQNGHSDTVSLLIKTGAQVDMADEAGVTSLVLAAQSGYTNILHLLVKKGANVNAKLKDDLTPLLCAVQADCKNTAAALLRSGALVNAANNVGFTSLHVASLYGYVDIVHVLLDNGATTDCQTCDNMTPLHLATLSGSSEIVYALVKAGIDLNFQCFNGTTPLDFAVYSNNREMVKILCEAGAKINLHKSAGSIAFPVNSARNKMFTVEALAELIEKMRDDDFSSPLGIAVQQGSLELVCDLLSYGADPNFINCNTTTIFPLHSACLKGYSDIVRKLLESGANIEVRSLEQFTPLFAAVQGNKLEVVKILLEAKADVNVRNIEGATPLVMAVELADIELTGELLKHGAEVDEAFNDITPLYLACKLSDPSKVKLLLEHDADVNKATNQGWSPLHAAAASADNKEIIDLLLDYGADTEFTSIEGLTPLHLASQNGHINVVSVLLLRGAKYNVTALDGATPLYLASYFGNFNVVKRLLEQGADVNIATVEKLTPLHSAVGGKHADIVKELLRAKADVNVTNKHGHTPLHLAILTFSMEIICDLLVNGAFIDPYIEYLMQTKLTLR